MTLSFKEFATQFLSLKLPVKALKAASAAGFARPPISLRALISTAAPLQPNVSKVPLLDCSNNIEPRPGGWPPEVVFSWVDEATYGSPPPDPRRQATWWNLTVWEASSLHPAWPDTPVINTTVPQRNQTGGVVRYTYTSIRLHGEYTCQITAFNDYGSALIGIGPVAITVPGTSPTITVTKVGGPNAEFTITGSGFTPGGNVKLLAWAPGNNGWGSIWTIPADPHGNINTFTYCQGICSKAGGGQLQFTATDLATSTQATGNGNCP